eukprot:CAMPEP_0194353792 /NCGR_PEP_ID=MMETSP0174-20130528/2029_1 /TAXON_ID=216777 /ORGANISM="Proboscia alata, Strain PI-D3" /LENGTH=835 /DNA_ID=CAMNT_0039122469 /DNA_START=142 /DNA_END=2649 /DNA_ORIENTATION=+
MEGVVAYIGNVETLDAFVWFGIRLTGNSIGCGDNNGSINNKDYFMGPLCGPRDGVFVRSSGIIPRKAIARFDQVIDQEVFTKVDPLAKSPKISTHMPIEEVSSISHRSSAKQILKQDLIEVASNIRSKPIGVDPIQGKVTTREIRLGELSKISPHPLLETSKEFRGKSLALPSTSPAIMIKENYNPATSKTPGAHVIRGPDYDEHQTSDTSFALRTPENAILVTSIPDTPLAVPHAALVDNETRAIDLPLVIATKQDDIIPESFMRKNRKLFIGAIIGFLFFSVLAVIVLTLSPPNSEKNNPITKSEPTTARLTELPSDVPTSVQSTELPRNTPTSARPTELPSNIPTSARPTELPSNVPTTLHPSNLPTGKRKWQLKDVETANMNVYTHEQFGSAVALSSNGRRLAVSDRSNSTDYQVQDECLSSSSSSSEIYYSDSSGYVQVYELVDGITWVDIGPPICPLELIGCCSTLSLSADGFIVALGAPDISWSEEGYAGGVQVFAFNSEANDWESMGQVLTGTDVCNTNSYDSCNFYGYSVDLSSSGSVLALGSPGFSSASDCCWAGIAQVFQWDDSGAGRWKQMGSDIFDDYGYSFGQDLSLSGDGYTLSVSDPASEIGPDESGMCRFFKWNGVDWEKFGNDVLGEERHNQLGWSVALANDGNTVVVGAPGAVSGGVVKVFIQIGNFGSSWVQLGSDILPDDENAPITYDDDAERRYDTFGNDVAISSDGRVIAVGAPSCSDGDIIKLIQRSDCSSLGYVQVFRYFDQKWVPDETLFGVFASYKISGTQVGSKFGAAVTLSSDGNFLAVGAPYADDDIYPHTFKRGEVYIYEFISQ